MVCISGLARYSTVFLCLSSILLALGLLLLLLRCIVEKNHKIYKANI